MKPLPRPHPSPPFHRLPFTADLCLRLTFSEFYLMCLSGALKATLCALFLLLLQSFTDMVRCWHIIGGGVWLAGTQRDTSVWLLWGQQSDCVCVLMCSMTLPLPLPATFSLHRLIPWGTESWGRTHYFNLPVTFHVSTRVLISSFSKLWSKNPRMSFFFSPFFSLPFSKLPHQYFFLLIWHLLSSVCLLSPFCFMTFSFLIVLAALHSPFSVSEISQSKWKITLLACMKTAVTVSLCLWSWSSYPAVNRYSSSSLSSQASNEVSNITGQSESSDEVFNMQVGLPHSEHLLQTL